MRDFKTYKPGRFAHLMKKHFVREMWDYITDDSRVQTMIAASSEGKPAIGPVLSDIETRFEEHLASKEYPDEEIAVLVNNMLRQVLEKSGFKLIACALCPGARYIKSSGLFAKRPPAKRSR